MSSGALAAVGSDQGSASAGTRRLALRLALGGLRAPGQSAVAADYLGTVIGLDAARREWTGNLISTAAYECLETAVRLGAADSMVTLACDVSGDEVRIACQFVVDEVHRAGAQALAGRVAGEATGRVTALLAAGELDAAGLSELGLGMVAVSLAAETTARCGDDGAMELGFRMALEGAGGTGA